MHLWRRLGIIQVNLASALALHKRWVLLANVQIFIRNIDVLLREWRIIGDVCRTIYEANLFRAFCRTPLLSGRGLVIKNERHFRRKTSRCNLSGWLDSNQRPHAPQTRTLTGLSYTPNIAKRRYRIASAKVGLYFRVAKPNGVFFAQKLDIFVQNAPESRVSRLCLSCQKAFALCQ